MKSFQDSETESDGRAEDATGLGSEALGLGNGLGLP